MIELIVLHKTRRNLEVDNFLKEFIYSLVGEIQKMGINVQRFLSRENTDDKSKLSVVLFGKILCFLNCFLEGFNFCTVEGVAFKYEIIEVKH